MLIKFILHNNLYQDLEQKLYNSHVSKSITYGFIPVKILNQFWILTCLNGLEGFLMEYRKNINITLYLEKETINLCLNSIISFTEENFNPSYNYDCYIDSMCNFILIRFNYANLNYINLDLINFDNIDYSNHDIKSNNMDTNIDIQTLMYSWTNYKLENTYWNKKTILKYVWDEKYLNFPPIPYIIDNKNINPKLNPITGAGLYNKEELIGMVMFVSEFNIIIAPTICIKKISHYLEGEKNLFLGVDLFPVNFNFKSEFNNINFTNGLIIANNYYNNYLKKKKSKNIYNYQECNYIDNNDIKQHELEQHNLKQNIDKKNKLINITKENAKILLKKNILCSIDNFKINSSGYLITNSKKFTNIIPLKSYIWLYKSRLNNTLKIEYLPNNMYKINLIELTREYLTIDDSYITKKISISKNIILLDNYHNDYNNISSITPNEIKYIRYNNKILIELNEKIIFLLKEIIKEKPYYYQNIFEKIFTQRYNFNNKKIIIGMDINDRLPILKIINNYKNFNDIINKYNTKKELKKFILNNI